MCRMFGRRLAALFVLFAAVGIAQAQVVVSQAYGGGGNTGATLRNDFIELHNNGTSSVDLSGWSVQYASSTGTTWSRTNLSGSIAPGGYYLVQQAVGTGGTVNLPTPDAIGTIAMSGTAGKVILVNNQTTLTGTCPSGASIIDIVGYGAAANCFEGAGPTPAPSNTLAVLRADSGCTDTGSNSADFATGTPNPRNSATAAFVCGGGATPVLSINDVSLFEGDSGTTTATFTVSLNIPAGASGVSFDIATADGTAIAGSDYVARALTGQTIAAGNNTYSLSVTINGDTTTEGNETFFVNITNVTGALAGDVQGLGTIQNDDVSVVQIHDIQGNGLTSPIIGAAVTTEGIVTAQRFNNGFFLQTADAEVDADPNTSQGIFVFTSTAPPVSATVGNRVRVTGTVAEFTPSTNRNQLSITQIASVTSIQMLSAGNPLPAPIALTTADFNARSTPGTAEKFEGMRVSAANAVAITGSSGNITESSATSTTTGVFQMVLSGVERPFREEGIDVLDTFPIPVGKTPPRFDHNPERIMVRSRDQIGATALALDADTIIDSIVGVMDYFSGVWAILPDPGALAISGSKTPLAVSDQRYEDVTIGAFNLLRFFDEVNDSNGAPTLTAAALDRRLTKTSLAICDYLKTPDILGVVEIENLRVLGLLADRINSTCPTAPAYVPYLVQGSDPGGINVGFLVSNRSLGATNRVEVLEVTQFGAATLQVNPNGTTSILNDRPPLLLRAIVHQDNGAIYPLTVIVNHLRSLNGVGDTTPGSNGWPTENARVSDKRAQQAVFLADLVHTRQQANPNERIVLIGDFNAFEFNDGYSDVMGIIQGTQAPEVEIITFLPSPIASPLINGSELITDPAQRYSFVFDGNAQTLDHAVVNEALVLSADDLEVEHARINADFGVHNFGIAGTPLRVSDHDPLRLRITVPAFASADLSMSAGASSSSVAAGGSITFTATAGNAGPSDAASAAVALVFNAVLSPTVTAPAGWACAAPVQTATDTTVTCTTATFANGTQAAFSAVVTAPSLPTPSTLEMAASVQSQTSDLANANNTATAQVSVAAVALPAADLSLRMIGGPSGFIRSGSTALFSVPVRNTGPNAVSQAVVTFTGTIPLANANVIAPAGWTCPRSTTPTGFSIVCTNSGTLAVGARQSFTFSGLAPSHLVQSSMSMTSRVSSTTTTDPVPGNNASVYTVNIVAP